MAHTCKKSSQTWHMCQTSAVKHDTHPSNIYSQTQVSIAQDILGKDNNNNNGSKVRFSLERHHRGPQGLQNPSTTMMPIRRWPLTLQITQIHRINEVNRKTMARKIIQQATEQANVITSSNLVPPTHLLCYGWQTRRGVWLKALPHKVDDVLTAQHSPAEQQCGNQEHTSTKSQPQTPIQLALSQTVSFYRCLTLLTIVVGTYDLD